eukprot:TRINITY_DN34291_c0_g1_i1.p1 TRINITY_DN34291_c0_g1~~TRINITY_DN34291_c0_g1_i1.p1  ORF type:complete len:324 (+),score=52.48 TRINITY_DN34291_c0_g1_i1:52-972(+)
MESKDLSSVRTSLLLRDPAHVGEVEETKLRNVSNTEEARKKDVFPEMSAVPTVSEVRQYLKDNPGLFEFCTEGNVPVILTAPHGGRTALPHGEIRTFPSWYPAGVKFSKTGDISTDKVALSAVELLHRNYGIKPFYVVAKCHRRYVDLNRAPSLAYAQGSRQGNLYYYSYHSLVETCIKKIGSKSALLLDIHGHGDSRSPNITYRGTGHGRTCTLVDTPYGHPVLAGMVSRAVDVHPKEGFSEKPGFSGGWTVQCYGLASFQGVECIQLEFGKDYRLSEDGINKAAQGIAAGVARHLNLQGGDAGG